MLGASDMVSVNIRSSLIQLATPDAMRGRVSAVNMLFIGASNELGEFESGITAAWFGTVPAVVLGGLGTLVGGGGLDETVSAASPGQHSSAKSPSRPTGDALEIVAQME